MTLSAHAAFDRAETLTPKLDALFQDYNQPGSPGASVMVIHRGKVLAAKGYGLANIEEKTPCDPETNFRLASVTKQFTAMSVLILAERKKLSLDEHLTDIMPEFPAYGREITLRHLLNHTSGLLDYEDLIPKGTEIPVLDRDVLRLLMQQDKTYFSPGTKYRYSNSAYALLALVVEQRSGNTFAHFLRQNIFRPLRMTSTLAYERGLSVVPNRAYGYSSDAGRFKRTDQNLTSSVLGDGGIYSSVTDLCRWDQALYTDKLVSKRTLKLAFTPGPVTDRPDTSYGFGWYVTQYRGMREIYHSGTSVGFTTRLARFPEREFTVIILTNRDEANIAELPHRIADLYLPEAK
ncbi:MAG TPA: serine hydrolase domain-containing protein [Candidatus Paceibacterota bacterium]|nr:serine hydrolase domain-containing protein [Verrucomicrobiota bacterium]HSA11999.1 serine hydrolase domain-containing protein [Candidatus Paceibacterota bacterium]